jgi:hypothetical protein
MLYLSANYTSFARALRMRAWRGTGKPLSPAHQRIGRKFPAVSGNLFSGKYVLMVGGTSGLPWFSPRILLKSFNVNPADSQYDDMREKNFKNQ